MSNPWDVPPFPVRGDDDIEHTYAGVGRVLSQWETLELELGFIYGLLLNQLEDIEAVRRYGEPKIFEERIKGLSAVASEYFKWNPHQETEAELDALLMSARQFAARRNDIAHSIVRPIQWIARDMDEGPLQFCAVPPLYLARKFDARNMPSFVYASVELAALTLDLHRSVVEPAQRLRLKLALGEDGAPPERQ
jgi:hypothetical protein